MLSEVDWGVHEIHTGGQMLSEVDWGAHQTHTSEWMLLEVDLGAPDSSLILYQKHIDHDGDLKDFFTTGLWGGLPQGNLSTPLMEYLEASLDTGQTEDRLDKFKSIQDHRGPYTLLDPEYLGSSYYLLIEWETGEITWEPLTNIMADFKHCENSKQGLWLMDILPRKQLKLFTQELVH